MVGPHTLIVMVSGRSARRRAVSVGVVVSVSVRTR